MKNCAYALMRRLHLQLGCLLAALLLYGGPGLAGENGDTKTYTFGIVPQFDSRQIRAIWRPILKELEQRTGMRFVIRGSPTIPDFEQQFMAGRFDFAYMNPYHLVLAHEAQGYAPLVRDVGRTLYGVLVVPKDSPIETVSDLDGKMVAFPAPNALGASLLLRADFNDVFKIKVFPRYVKTHSSVYLNVILGDVSAGGGVQKTLNQQPSHIGDKLRVLYRTREVPPHPVAAHSRITEAEREKVRAALLAMGENEKGKALLAKVPMKQIGPTGIADYEPLHEWGLERFYSTN